MMTKPHSGDDSRPIGVFDSGHGGLTILKALHQRLARQDFLYLGDHANAPYGAKDAAEILALTKKGVGWLFDQGCQLVILACNTASAVALRQLQQDWLEQAYPGRRCLGVLVPIIEEIARNPWHAIAGPADWDRAPETLAVFATPATVESGAYSREVAKRAPRVKVVEQACPDLASLIERDAPAAELQASITTHVAALKTKLDGKAPDSVVLGCTHYPLVENLFRAALPEETRLVSQPQRVADALTAYLFRHPRMKHFSEQAGEIGAFTTGDPALVSALASRFFGRHLAFAAADAVRVGKAESHA